MRNLMAVALGLAFALTPAGRVGVWAAPPEPDDAFQQSLQALLTHGLERRTELSRLSSYAAAARRARPDDPVADYVLALASLKRIQDDDALRHLRRAIRTDPTHLPSWRVLLRQRLVEREHDALRSETMELAAAAANPALDWPVDGRQQAAALLGRVAGYLSLPDVDAPPAEQVAKWEQAVRGRIGVDLAAAFDASRQKLAEDRQALRTKLAEQAKEAQARAKLRSESTQQDIQDRRGDVADQRDNLRLSADDWKTWIQDQLDQADDDLRKLERDYQTIETAAGQIGALMTRTEIELGRRQTALEFQGVGGRRAATDPVLLQLQQDYLALLARRQACERQAAATLAQARTVIANRAAAVVRFERATGEIVQQRARLGQWDKRLKKSQAKAADQADATGQVQSIEARAALPGSYFELDFERERSELEKHYGLTNADDPD